MSATVLCAATEIDAEELELGGDRFHHLFRVRRVRAGERVRLTDGEGRARWSEVVEVGRDRALLRIAEVAAPNEPAVAVDLWVAAPKPSRASWLVEKCTELGVGSIRFFECERGPRRIEPRALERLERVAAAALEQCHRARLPRLLAGSSLEEIGEGEAGVPTLLLDPEASTPLAALGAGPARLVVGPEGGFTEDEAARLARLGASRASLVPSVLRIETAAVAACAVRLAAVIAR